MEALGVTAAQQEIRQVLDDAGAACYLHVREIGRPRGVDVDADALVTVASVIKVVIAVAFARAVEDGSLDPRERVTVPARYRVGGTGSAGCRDDVEMSLQDLALFMMSMSDNAATDLVAERVGLPAIEGVISDLGLPTTRMVADMATLHREVVDELGLDPAGDLDEQVRAAGDRAWTLAWIDPTRTNRSTPREMGTLLEAIWTDRAGAPAACSRVRELMSHQVTTHRLASGFGDEVLVDSKTGTVPAWRNDAGVLSYPDGRRYVAAVFTRARSLEDRLPLVDAAIGRCARIAVDALRAE